MHKPVLDPRADHADSVAGVGEIAEPRAHPRLQADGGEDLIDRSVEGEQPAPDDADDDRAHHLRDEQAGAKERHPAQLAARHQRSEEQADQDGDDGVEDDEEGVVADGAEHVRVADQFGVVGEADVGRLAEAGPVVEAVADRAEDRQQDECHVNHKAGQDEEVGLLTVAERAAVARRVEGADQALGESGCCVEISWCHA